MEKRASGRRLAWSTAIFSLATGLSRILGLVRETEGIATQVLRNLKVSPEDVRAKVLEILDAHDAEGDS